MRQKDHEMYQKHHEVMEKCHRDVSDALAKASEAGEDEDAPNGTGPKLLASLADTFKQISDAHAESAGYHADCMKSLDSGDLEKRDSGDLMKRLLRLEGAIVPDSVAGPFAGGEDPRRAKLSPRFGSPTVADVEASMGKNEPLPEALAKMID
jgi:hypothetical protein